MNSLKSTPRGPSCLQSPGLCFCLSSSLSHSVTDSSFIEAQALFKSRQFLPKECGASGGVSGTFMGWEKSRLLVPHNLTLP